VCDGTRVVPRHIVHSLQQQGGKLRGGNQSKGRQ
jgi:hypothetical protein